VTVKVCASEMASAKGAAEVSPAKVARYNDWALVSVYVPSLSPGRALS
jgi:hypothetical protein